MKEELINEFSCESLTRAGGGINPCGDWAEDRRGGPFEKTQNSKGGA